MLKRSLVLISCCFLLASCQSNSLSINTESSSIIVDSNTSSLIIQALIENERPWETETMYAEFEMLNDELAYQLEASTLYYNTDQRGIPEQFTISPDYGRFLHVQFDFNGSLTEEKLQENIQVNVYDENHDPLETLSMTDVDVSYR